ncbi:2-oxoglutarate synthase|uniref:2-oxoglutarate ferredoxin oxidoreductase subunit beta n=1 Tax=Dendrosporobacter quercicolus TaxID=146817 RepID=A0A1G9N542_9FIRM|nr:thiamine pyrophosphate-dependent enzyme [Dendrosporobacter quercicolus]NSL47235.1 2-oxoglutarate synthase [Dendrosporobacter quercicolus DSM 1736]SDL81662.1 2-oxoglutarate ferredoxin oxidoreductase subunit beta [Dendrosporobacter quercicolus]
MQELIENNILQPAMPTCWNEASKPHKFCPGCGHGVILKALGEAVDELGLRDRIVFGCDIGCSLLAWDFFDFDTVQTHHGRTTPVITGMKRAKPEIAGIAYMGDGGGYAIGSQHLFNAAVRNEKITVIVCNNSNYGMTGGQMSPTSLPGMKTETSPYGRDILQTGAPTKGPEMVAAVAPEGAYVARGTVANVRQLKGFIKKALENQLAGNGFSFVEALSGCPTNWRTNAKQTWEFIEKDMTQYFKVGELRPLQAKEG